MGRRAVAVIGAVVLAAVGCGGRVIDESAVDTPRDSGPHPSTNSNNPNNPSNPSNSGNPNDFVGGSVALPDCKLGSAPVTGGPCEFMNGGLCYDTKIKACACACPKKTGTVCASGFPNSQGRVVVTCS